MLLYAAAMLVLTGTQNYRDIDSPSGLASVFNDEGVPIFATIIPLFMVMSILAVMLHLVQGPKWTQ